MHADTVLTILLTALAAAALPLAALLRAQKRIRDLEMTLLAQTTDADRYEELRGLLQQMVLQTDQLADNQAQLARRLTERVEALPPPRLDLAQPSTPH
jgi:cytochrome c-type biogenesis protein CcmH/NrfF